MEFVVAADASRSAGMSDRRKAAPGRARPWAFLSPELLADVCARLHDAADFVRFHAVCAPWRDAPPSMLSPETPPHTFLPWLVVSQSNGRVMHSPVLYSGRATCEPKPEDRHQRGYYGGVLPEPATLSVGNHRNLVGSADGRSVWIFTAAAAGPEPSLLDLVTGAANLLPPFASDQVEMSNPHGITYGDGTVFLYSFGYDASGYDRPKTVFRAAVLRPGDTAWAVVETRLNLPALPYNSCAAYHGGKVLVWAGAYFWCVVTPGFEARRIETIDGVLETTWDRVEDERYDRDHNYVLESRGELWWVCVLVEHRRGDNYNYKAMYNVAPKLAVRVHALEEEEEEADGSGKMHWVEKDGRSLGDRVLFLGSPASFAADATGLGMESGCAYFVFDDRVFRYSFIDDAEAKPVESMFAGRAGSNQGCLWLRPQQPRIAPIMEIQERLETQNTKKGKPI